MRSVESGKSERVVVGARRTRQERWAAAAHSDETFAAPEPAETRNPNALWSRTYSLKSSSMLCCP